MAKVYEILTVFKSVLVNMTRQGISQDDIIYLDLHREYVKLLQEGQKEADIRAFLSQKYKLSASTIQKAIKRLNQEYEL